MLLKQYIVPEIWSKSESLSLSASFSRAGISSSVWTAAEASAKVVVGGWGNTYIMQLYMMSLLGEQKESWHKNIRWEPKISTSETATGADPAAHAALSTA